ncbi:chemotaxis protein CheD [Desulfitobacterium hafniense]|uniref:Probable chemoreceptor glutamine deamidase CheD n=4 Tax=root TaxID=1 RepID=CHED_DESHY|nr:chemotaxis protein CheD [Desulfitobacterium hafniense]B8FTP6.1 RecName: Full=Probable chemoreceptor glutamine deamidase CheD [Desulfitobacterium hafniense DCB-2]Q24T84.1 RecName: Full=Probable chemoreceptor glutamine deamidase CheD [Desulfitobacterium hafniense Y51]ACL22138.1 CheD [Desulfitobacterium hafniense DCB-2]EHL04569.1 putative chemoreceptor glutamine deamidase CheD [Desulfitobacterium hafniense DP7]MEA5021273.1 chemotaxis protein CheD [Desulfitobacterium hafniense]BAE84758.1 hypot
MSNVISVGMADLKTTKAPNILMTAGLGSCIGICVHDPIQKVGGMAHIMLPTAGSAPGGNPAKYADTAMDLLVTEILRLGASKSRLRAKMAGGAQMFSFPGKPPVLKIGDRNAEQVIVELKRLGIPLLVSDVGGSFGRTIHFDVGTGDLKVRTINHGEKVI